MRVPFAVTFLLLINIAQAQTNNGVAAKYGESITAAGLSRQLHIIAGPEMEGRETATRGQERAAAYIISQFSAAGLQPGANGQWEQHYPIYSDSLLRSSITVRNKTYSFAQDFLADLRASGKQDLQVSRVFYAGEGTVIADRNDYRDMDVKDQVVMIRDDIRKGLQRDRRSLDERIATARQKGVAALLIISPAAGRYRSLEQKKTAHYRSLLAERHLPESEHLLHHTRTGCRHTQYR